MKMVVAPCFRELDRTEIDAILARNHLGRMAFARGNHIDIEPIHYVHSNGWLYGRTSPGRKVEMTGAGWWPIAFQVDEVEDLFRWRSVVIHGGFYTLNAEGPAWERAEVVKAIGILRTLVPETFTREDPIPGRTVIFRIAVQEVSGRAAVRQGEG